MYQGKRTLVVVPARGGSKGIKLKNIQPLAGLPLIAHVGNVVKELKWVDRAIVSTDHPEIAAIATKFGLASPFTRPQELSGDVISDFAVLTHAVNTMEQLDQTTYDVIIMLQPTSPLRRPQHVVDCVDKLLTDTLDAVWTLSPTDLKYHPLKQLTLDPATGHARYFDPGGAHIIARQQISEPRLYHRNGLAYAITRDCLLNKKSIMGDKAGAVIVTEPLANIDDWDDFKYAEFLLSNRDTSQLR